MGNNYIKIIEHYEECLDKYGDCHLGVDWPKLSDVYKRYEVMLGIANYNSTTTILDFGCGASHLYEYIIKNNLKNIVYSGLDISNKFIELCESKYDNVQYYCVDILKDTKFATKFDYVLMNGVFTEKRDLTYEEMLNYFKKLIMRVYSLCNKGIAFNVMSKNVDWEREDLFHLSLDELTKFITKHITRNFVIRNDYGLYEYTVYIYK